MGSDERNSYICQTIGLPRRLASLVPALMVRRAICIRQLRAEPLSGAYPSAHAIIAQ